MKRSVTCQILIRDKATANPARVIQADGVPLEEVSKLLGHESTKTTERHYTK